MNQTVTAPAPRGDLLRWNSATGTLRARRYRVEVVAGPAAGARLVLDRPMRVGSHPDAELPVADGTVSRFHLELDPRSEGVRIRDLGSRNGTYLAGIRVAEAVLEAEATLTLGLTRLRVCVEEDDLGEPEALSQFGPLVGRSEAMKRLLGLVQRVSQSDATVLLQGETGTGKDLLARTIHQASARRNGPFVVVDCSAIPAELSESELFGHVKGAFTGASASRRGAFMDADGGTVFLDEVGELPLELQPRLLRVLETGEIRAVGGDVVRTVDVRVIAATHRNLEQAVAQTLFRGDLFFRLSVIALRVPPLRERLEDLPLLAHHFASRPGASFGPAFLGHLAHHGWPGNVRELRNVIQRAEVLFSDVDALEQLSGDEVHRLLLAHSADEGFERPPMVGAPAADDEDAQEHARIVEALRRCGGNQSKAASLLGISRGTLIARIRRFNLPRPRKGPR